MNCVTHKFEIANFAVGPILAHGWPLQSLYNTMYINIPIIYSLLSLCTRNANKNQFAKLSPNALIPNQISQAFSPSYFAAKILEK